jgi:hypothetical protein
MGDVASASHVMMGRVHSRARIALLGGPRAAGAVKRVASPSSSVLLF